MGYQKPIWVSYNTFKKYSKTNIYYLSNSIQNLKLYTWLKETLVIGIGYMIKRERIIFQKTITILLNIFKALLQHKLIYKHVTKYTRNGVM